MKLILYSTHCPKCTILEKKLQEKGLNYTVVTDVDVMEKKGFISTPMLETEDEVMDFVKANKWLKTMD